MIAVGYVRVSTARQDNSLDMQPDLIRRAAESAGYSLLNIFCDEDVSGGTPIKERPEGAKMMELVERGEVDFVLSTEIQRMFRCTIDGLLTIRIFEKMDVGLVLTQQGNIINTKTPEGLFYAVMNLAYSEVERLKIGERTRNVARDRKKKGKTYCRSIYGYDNLDGRLVENEQEQKVIKMVKEMRKRSSLNHIAMHLNQNGIKTKEGKTWWAQTVKEIINRKENEFTGEKKDLC